MVSSGNIKAKELIFFSAYPLTFEQTRSFAASDARIQAEIGFNRML